MARRVTVFLLALFVTYVLAAAAATQSVLARLGEMGIKITFNHRLTATGHDLLGMAGTFLPLLGVGLLLAFLATALIVRRASPHGRTIMFVLAGAAAVIVVHVSLKLVLDITPVAAARTAGGMLIQAAAGAFGGLIYSLATTFPLRSG